MADSLLIRVATEGASTARDEMRALADGTKAVGSDAEIAGVKFDKSMGVMRDGLRSAIGFVGAAGLAFGIKDVVSAGMKLQAQQTALKQTLKTTGGEGVDAYSKIADAAEKASTAGGFSTEENLSSANAFLHQTHSVSESLTAMSAATDLARARGMGLAQAQNVVMRGLTGATSMMDKYVHGLVPVTTAQQRLTDSSKAQVDAWTNQATAMNAANAGSGTRYLQAMELAHGATKAQTEQAEAIDKTATAQRAMALLTAQYGGQQSKYAQTAQGKLESLGNAFKNLEANMGESLLPEVKAAAGAMEGFAKFLDRNRWAAYALVGVVTALGVDALGGSLVKGAKDGAKAVKAVGSAAQWVAGKLTSLGAAQAEEGAASDAGAAQMTIFDVATGEAAVTTDVLTGSVTLLGVALDALGIGLVIAAVAALVIGIVELVKHFHAVEQAGLVAWRAIETAATVAWHGIESGFDYTVNKLKGYWTDITHFGTVAWHGIEHGATTAADWITGAFKSALHWVENAWKNTMSFISHDTPLGALGQLAGGHIGGALHALSFGALNTGGVVEAHQTAAAPPSGGPSLGGPPAKHLYTGGPAGTDTVPGWLTPGEDVLSRAGATTLNGMIGEGGLSALNAGVNPFGGGLGGGQNITITPGVAEFRVDGKVLAKAVVHYTLQKAARGPSSLVGGSLVTGR